MTSGSWLHLGTRGSPLALAQAHETQRLLGHAHGRLAEDIALHVIRTTGDRIQDRTLALAGGKGLFTKELDDAMLEGVIDIAVHSAKDLPTRLPDGIVVAGYLPREDARDALICAKSATIAGLPQGASLGSASLRRQAMMLRLRPDLKPQLLRGNVETRLRKVESGEVDVTLLAIAGLKRLGLAHRAAALLDIDDFVPAVGQGAIAITARAGDTRTLLAMQPILHAATAWALAAERAFLDVLDGSCRTPIAGHARINGAALTFSGAIYSLDGGQAFEASLSGAADDGARVGSEAGRDIRARAPASMFLNS